MSKILVTGGCGFLGSHVCELFRRKGWDVIAYDNLTKYELFRTGYRANNARDYKWNYLRELGVELAKGDIRDLNEVFKAVEGCDFIVHTAAQPAMTISMENPLLDHSVNVQGTLSLLEASRKFDVPMVSCSTIHVYGNKINETLSQNKAHYFRIPPTIDESHPIMKGTLTPLHASKRAAELYVQTYIDTYGLKAATFRYTGIYGPRQFGGEDHGWVANFAIRTIMNCPITIFGSGKQVRDILYASDAAKAFDCFYRNQKPGIYNIGGGLECATSLLECISLIEKLTKRKASINFYPVRKGDLYYFICDITKAKMELGWFPEVTPEHGVLKLIRWVKDNKELFG